MGLLKTTLQRWMTDRDLQDLTRGEVDAVIDALAMGVFADFEVNSYEEDEFSALLTALTWGRQSSGTFQAQAETARFKAQAMGSEEALEDFAADIASRLPKTVVEKVYSMLASIAAADNELNSDEEAVLAAFANAFGIGADRADAIYKRTLLAIGKVDDPS